VFVGTQSKRAVSIQYGLSGYRRFVNACVSASREKELLMEDLYYSDYIELDTILNSQHPKSFETLEEANDEMLFIIIHQVYELWFKQILFELDLVRNTFIRDRINDNSDDLSKVVQKLKRIGKILELINQQVSVLETMTALDFLEFRNLLLPASGFQSKQFRLIEAKLGLKMDQRYKREYYKSTRRGSLSQTDLEDVDRAESEPTLKELIIRWLERMPYLDEKYWSEYQQATESNYEDRHKFWVDYQNAYRRSLSPNETDRLAEFDKVFFEAGRGDVPAGAMRAALFITIYRNLPIFHLPFELLNALSEIDELLSNWRYRHFLMVRRMIGIRVGTGGTSGAGYLEGTLSQHYAFREITELATFLIERSKRPALPNALKEKVSFNL
jgi:tryptophan 2,3-dioxygenase